MTETELVEAVAGAYFAKCAELASPAAPVVSLDSLKEGRREQVIECFHAAIEAMQPALREAELRGMKRMQDAILAECEGFSEDMGWGFCHVLDAIKDIPLSLGGSDGAQN